MWHLSASPPLIFSLAAAFHYRVISHTVKLDTIMIIMTTSISWIPRAEDFRQAAAQRWLESRSELRLMRVPRWVSTPPLHYPLSQALPTFTTCE